MPEHLSEATHPTSDEQCGRHDGGRPPSATHPGNIKGPYINNQHILKIVLRHTAAVNSDNGGCWHDAGLPLGNFYDIRLATTTHERRKRTARTACAPSSTLALPYIPQPTWQMHDSCIAQERSRIGGFRYLAMTPTPAFITPAWASALFRATRAQTPSQHTQLNTRERFCRGRRSYGHPVATWRKGAQNTTHRPKPRRLAPTLCTLTSAKLGIAPLARAPLAAGCMVHRAVRACKCMTQAHDTAMHATGHKAHDTLRPDNCLPWSHECHNTAHATQQNARDSFARTPDEENPPGVDGGGQPTLRHDHGATRLGAKQPRAKLYLSTEQCLTETGHTHRRARALHPWIKHPLPGTSATDRTVGS